MVWHLFLLLFARLWAADPAWDALVRHEELWHGTEAVSLYFVDRVDLQPLLEGRTHRNPEVRRLIKQRVETNLVLGSIAPQILWTYLRRGLFDPTLVKARDLVARYRWGASRVMGVTLFADPYTAFETVGAGPEGDSGDGHIWTPTERRCVGRGMVPLERSPISPRRVKMRYIHPDGGLKFDEEVEAFLGKIEHWVGGYIEVKGASRPDYSERPEQKLSDWMRGDFGPHLHRLLIRDHWSLFTEVPVPYALPPLEGALKEEADALKARYPSLPDELIYPDKQRWVIADKLMVHSVSAGAARLYEKGSAFDPPSQTFFDEDFERTAYISLITREKFENEAGDLFAQRPAFRLVENSQMRSSDLSPVHCSSLIDIRTFDRSKLPSNYVPIMRAVDHRNLTIPRESPLFPFYRALSTDK